MHSCELRSITKILFARIDPADRMSLWLTDAEKPSPVQVAGPIEGGKDAWFGYYGHIGWGARFDWRR